MQKYQCKKVVEAALLIGMAEGEDDMLALITDEKDENGQNKIVMAKKDIISRYQPKQGDYVVKYSDDYLAISPGDVFKDGYDPIDG